MHSRNPNICLITSLTITEFKEGYFIPLKLPSPTEPVPVWEPKINFKDSKTLSSFHDWGMGDYSLGKLGILLAPQLPLETKCMHIEIHMLGRPCESSF